MLNKVTFFFVIAVLFSVDILKLWFKVLCIIAKIKNRTKLVCFKAEFVFTINSDVLVYKLDLLFIYNEQLMKKNWQVEFYIMMVHIFSDIAGFI